MLRSKRRLYKAFFERKFSGKAGHLDSSCFSFKFGKLASGETRFACVVSKKIAPLAVKRNQIRRRFYRILSELYVKVKPGFYGIFFLKKEVLKVSEALLKQEIETVLKKASILGI